jgi:hypothetical protein
MPMPTPLEEELEEFVGFVETQHAGPPDGQLFHYTTAEGIQGILQTHSLHMTDYRHLNDPSEFRYSSEVINRCLERYANQPEIARILQPLQKLHGLLDSLDFIVCVFSFSETPKSLYEWRAYADDAKGFCIGMAPPASNYSRNLLQMIYDEDEQLITAENCMNNFVAICGKHPADALPPDKRAKYLFLCLLRLRTYFKHPAYADETEWRYANFPVAAEMMVKTANGRLTPYFPLESIRTSDGRLPITEIWLGPKQNEREGKQALAVLLERCGYDPSAVVVRKSEIPYRTR